MPWWLQQDPAVRPPFAEAVTIQNRVAEAKRGPKRPEEGAFDGPLNYAYHFDAVRLAAVLADRARALGVRHLADTLCEVSLDDQGRIAAVQTGSGATLVADLTSIAAGSGRS